MRGGTDPQGLILSRNFVDRRPAQDGLSIENARVILVHGADLAF